MGKQIATAMEYDDELMFLSYLNEKADIALIESFSNSVDSLLTNSFERVLSGHYTYYIWNKEFHWQPEYRQAENGLYYVYNTHDAPLIQFSRSNVEQNKYGRLYWAKTFAAPNGLKYDADRFNIWYEDVVKWIKKNSAGKVKDCGITYFLPDAWNLYLEKCETWSLSRNSRI